MPMLKFFRCSDLKISVKDLSIIDKAIKCAQDHDIPLDVVYDSKLVDSIINSAECDNQIIYICFPFKGKVFTALNKKSCRIIGPQCVISCLLLEVSVPKRLYPVCNVAMSGTVVCCSSMKKDDRKIIHELVKLMGGDVTNDFTNSVTHLIAQEVGSKKYQVACSRKVPCLLPSWVHFVWDKSQYEHIHSDNFFKEHMTPIFKGCTICVSGISDIEERNSIKLLVNSNGGLYSGELNMKTCTHLLVEKPQGQKYLFARQWKLHCVKPLWLYDCLKNGCWLDESPYKLENENEMPKISGVLQNDKIVNFLEESVLPSNISRVEALAVRSMSNSKMHKSLDTDSTTEENVLFKYFDPKIINLDEIILSEHPSTYFDGFKIYLCNITGALFDICRKIINNGGGFRLNNFTDSITHIVFSQSAPKELTNYIKELSNHLPYVVSPLWLIDSAKNNQAMPEQGYSLMDSLKMDEGFNSFSGLNDVFMKPIQLKSAEKKQVQPVATSLNFDDDDDGEKDNDLLKNYLPNNHESTRLSQVYDTNMQKPFESNLQPEETIVPDEETQTQAILQKKNFLVLRYDTEQSLRIKELIEEYSGLIVENYEQADHVIVPLTYNKRININPKEATVCWLEQSIDSEELKDINSSYLYRPIFLADDVKPLKNCVVTVSQYTGMERQHLFHLAELLGALAQDYFARRDGNDMVASTHLVLMKPEGSKYAASLKWNIPCVRQEWLFECARLGKKVPESNYSLLSEESPETDNSMKLKCLNVENNSKCENNEKYIEIAEEPAVDFKINNSTEKDQKSVNDFTKYDLDFSNFNKAIANERSLQSENVQFRVSNSFPAISNTPGLMNPLHLSFDFTDALDAVKSPVALSQDSFKRNRKSRGSLPFDIQFAEAMQRAVDMHVPEKDRNSFNNVSKDQNLSVLSGVVLVVSKALAQKQMELHKKAQHLGAECRFMYDSECTHFVHQGRVNDSNKDYMEAKRNKKYLVSPFWLEACLSSNEHVDEILYPVTFNPRMSLNVSSVKLPLAKEEETKNLKVPQTLTIENIAENVNEDFQKKMEQIMEATKTTAKSKRSRRTNSNNNFASINTRSGRRLSQNKSSSESLNRSDFFPKKDDDFNTEQSQGDYITYDDPGISERRRILEQLKRVSPSQDLESFIENLDSRNIIKECDEDRELKSENKPQTNLLSEHLKNNEIVFNHGQNNSIKNNENYQFLLSGMTAQEKINYAAIIEELGGIVHDVQYFNVMCTHVVVSVPNRNEKFLGSLASGKWILHKSFLEASRESGAFVDEVNHEWGSQPNASAFACSAKRWRIDLAAKRRLEPSVGAFIGWVVLLCIEPSKQLGFTRILEAGGAKLLCERPPFINILGATHAFIADKKQAKLLDFQVLTAAGILILKPEYISDYLTVFPIPSTSKYVISDMEIEKEPSALCKRTVASKRSDAENSSQQFTKRTRR
ncbi:DNA topoisomerase 2-binding protein 1-A isoform X1 [Hydra vulgaris]|uniref:DNA topoisomerase 2-binding protein 1-A isoform X1 n=1 Tax=Hydra vulgaris TaxID=6087 RepID=A0ABM4BL05_HYDVU